jgi:hypothetical protein
MRKIVFLLAVLPLLFAGCSKDDSEPENYNLVGTLWSAFNYKSAIDGTNVYRMIRFKNKSELEYYSASEKTKIIGDINVLPYVYNHPKISVTFNGENMNGNTIDGEITESYIKIGDYTYMKETAN